MSPAAAVRLAVEGPAGALEALIDNDAGTAASFAVVCHPHPLHGGTMDNKVVWSVAKALQGLGLPTLRFNFRGVGASAGTYDNGVGEALDAQAVADWGQARWPGKTLIAAGFSFGGAMAMRLAIARSAARLITISPAVGHFPLPDARVPECPWLIVQGDADDVVEPQVVTEFAAGLKRPPHLVMLAGAGHFFHGRLQELRAAVTEDFGAADQLSRP
jgi:uncharacterized protein